MTGNNGAVVLCGGGTDSLVLLKQIKAMGCNPIHVLFFDVGQSAAAQHWAASLAIAKIVGVTSVQKIYLRDQYRILLGEEYIENTKVFDPPDILASADTLEADFDASPGQSKADAKGLAWIPGRNTMFLMQAAIYAAARGIYRVYWGMQSELRELTKPGARWGEEYAGDDMWFPFLDKINRLLPNALGYPVEVLTPFMHNSKGEILRLGLGLGLTIQDFGKTYSCVSKQGKRCGICAQCSVLIEGVNDLDLDEEDLPEWWADMILSRHTHVAEKCGLTYAVYSTTNLISAPIDWVTGWYKGDNSSAIVGEDRKYALARCDYMLWLYREPWRLKEHESPDVKKLVGFIIQNFLVDYADASKADQVVAKGAIGESILERMIEDYFVEVALVEEYAESDEDEDYEEDEGDGALEVTFPLNEERIVNLSDERDE